MTALTIHPKFFLASILALLTFRGSSQLITAPNETKNGLKIGLWNEQEFLRLMDIDGSSRLLHGQHFDPLFVIGEGQYSNGKKNGIWMYYWIERSLDSETVKYKKGRLFEVIEFNDDFRNGLYISYMKSGNILLLGHYLKIAHHTVDTIHLDIDPEKPRDTVIVSEFASKMIGYWYEFNSDGSLKQRVDYGQ